MTHRLHIDIETYCERDIAKCGVYRYASDPSFEILLVAYAFGDEPVKVIDIAQGEEMPESFLLYLSDPSMVKCAHNATFERVCFSNWLRRHGYLREDEWLDPDQWFCTMVQASRCGLPMSLKDCGAALGLAEQKMGEGKALIKVFCTAHAAKGTLVTTTRVLPEDRPEDWATFKAYCRRDVEVERNIDRALAWNEPTAYEQHMYAIDQRINDHGVLIDIELAKRASEADTMTKARLVREMRVLTGLDNPNSVSQLKGWLTEQGVDLSAGVDKKAIGDLAKSAQSDIVRRVCAYRLELGKTSLAKYSTMLEVACADHRARGLMQFYGARTGRWAGRLIQMQNLPQNHISTLDWARRRLREGDIDSLELMYGNVPDTMSQLIRTAFIAPDGKTFAVCDFSAIEARVLAWLAGEEWVLEAFRQGKDIYCETASQMFCVPVEKHGQNADLRQKGKIAVLALGYAGGVGALDAMGGQRMGLTTEEEQEIVDKWRASNRKIVRFWDELAEAAKSALISGGSALVRPAGLVFRQANGWMALSLPSGRSIAYPHMALAPGRYGRQELSFWGTNQKTGRWEQLSTRGGTLAENVSQAVARDCLAHVMVQCEKADIPIVFHVHDEVICEVPDESYLKVLEDIFSHGPEWAKGLPLKGAGYCTKYYMKD